MPDNKIYITTKTSGGVLRLQYEHKKGGQSQGIRRCAHVQNGDQIQWHCGVGDYAILLKRAALSANVFSASKGIDTTPATVTAQNNSAPGADNTYPYSVVVVTPPDGIPVTDDPDIIIDP